MPRTKGALPREGEETVGVVLRGVSDRLRCGQSGIGEQLSFRIPDCARSFGGVRSEAGGVVGLACAERPPGQSRQHPGVAGGSVRLSVSVCRGVEQPFGPGQITQASGNSGLANDGVC